MMLLALTIAEFLHTEHLPHSEVKFSESDMENQEWGRVFRKMTAKKCNRAVTGSAPEKVLRRSNSAPSQSENTLAQSCKNSLER